MKKRAAFLERLGTVIEERPARPKARSCLEVPIGLYSVTAARSGVGDNAVRLFSYSCGISWERRPSRSR